MNKNKDTLLQKKTDSLFNFEQKINFEKRKRHQIYKTMDYFLSNVTFFDFFANDAFEIIKIAKYLAAFSEKKIVTSELLLCAFFEYDFEINTILKDYDLTWDYMTELLFANNPRYQDKSIQTNIEVLDTFLQEMANRNSYEKDVDLNTIPYSHEITLLFEKAAQNALTRFKTPVISSEILFITLMEEKETKASKIIKKCVQNDVQWQILRYRLLKNLHHQESFIKGEIIKNQHYFAYLLKANLPDAVLDQIIQEEKLSVAVLELRNILIYEFLKIDLLEHISLEVNQSIEITKSRKYSS